MTTTPPPRSASSPVLQLDGVTHPPSLAHPVDLTVQPGEVVAVLGPPGSGKTTLLSLAAGLLTPATGRVRIDRADVAALSRDALARLWVTDIARVPQDTESALDPHLTGAENIALPLELSGVAAATARQRALAVLLELELGELVDARPPSMSAAQRRALAVARALARQARLLLADEPTAGIDVELADALLAMLRLRRPAESAVVLATAHPEVAEWADRVVLIPDSPEATGPAVSRENAS